MFARRREAMRRGDDGSVLPMVLVLVVIGSLVILPLLDYAITVFRSNRVVSDRTAESEAAKGGLRVALADPRNVFLTCDGGGNLTPSPNPTINGISVQTTCAEIAEVGPTVALGFEVPTGAAAMQLGSSVPVALSGTTASSGAVPPYPASPDWWATPAQPDPLAQYSSSTEDDKIWMPDLPRIPPTVRTSTPYDMPAGFSCQVFFPGRYSSPVNLTGRMYFTSGVYYFEDAVTIASDADVVVGYGLSDFSPASDCADDYQVAANVINPTPAVPLTFDINGGGATFVFGANGRLVVDNSTIGTSARVRFNQRYADADRGGRVSIMSVNGDDLADAPHVVTDVNSIPRSFILDGTTQIPISASSYQPSSSTYTDKARLPAQLPDLDADPFQQAGSAPDRGVVLLTWDELTGQDAGGALLGDYDDFLGWTTPPYQVQQRVQPSGAWSDVCLPDELVVAGTQITCSVDGLDIDTEYRFRVRATNEVGNGAWRGRNVEPEASDPIVAVPGSPSNVLAVAGASDDVAQISWDEPTDNGGLPITGYQVDAYSIELVPHANVAPVAPPTPEHVVLEHPPLLGTDNSVVGHIRTYDPNGDDLTLTIDTTGLPAGLTAVADDVEDTITVTATDLSPSFGTFNVPYTVSDPSGASAAGAIEIDLVPFGGLHIHPPEADPVGLFADVGVPIISRLPVNDPDGLPLAAVPVTVDTTGLDATWNVTVSGINVTITTTAPDGMYTIPYTVTDASGSTASSTIDVPVARSVVYAGSCTVTTNPLYVTPTACEMPLPDLPAGTPTSGFQGYRFDVVATNTLGSSAPVSNAAPLPLGFDGGGVGLLGTPERRVEPWIPDPIVDIDLSGSTSVELAIAGYVAVPMGRVFLDNPNGFDVRINGAVLAGTFDITDSRATATPGSLPIGFKNDIVLQRKVRIVSVAKNVTSTAIVEVNEDGAGYAVNSWVVG